MASLSKKLLISTIINKRCNLKKNRFFYIFNVSHLTNHNWHMRQSKFLVTPERCGKPTEVEGVNYFDLSAEIWNF